MRSRIPKPAGGIDVYALPLNIQQGFVLSRVDGISTVDDIALMVGIKLDELLAILERLAELGAVELNWQPAPRPQAPAPAQVDKPAPGPTGTAAVANGGDEVELAVQRVLAQPGQLLYDASELDEPAALSPERKRDVLNVYYGFEGKDYYQALGLSRSATKKQIRAAYFALSKIFHTDSHFGKDLGTFKAKMEVVFKRLTEAYEVLGRQQRRREYDEYLASTATTHALQEGFDQVQSGVKALTEPPQEVVSPKVEPEPTPSPPTVVPASSAEAERRGRVAPRPPTSAAERRAQARERLRRNLSGAVRLGPSREAAARSDAVSGPVRPASSPTGRRDSAIKGLRDSLRQTGRGVSAGTDRVLSLLRKAKDAEQAGDLLGAAGALQEALVLQPNHRDLQEQYARVSRLVTRSLADNYEKQARYEEKQGKWSAAVTSWERVAEGRPEDNRAARAVAEAVLKASGDLDKARRHAQRAVDAAPSDVANVIVLARVLLAAGLRLNARRELEKAVKLDPQNEMIKNLLREAR